MYSQIQNGAFVSMKMKEIDESYCVQVNTNVQHAVVTVPVYFKDSQRQVT